MALSDLIYNFQSDPNRNKKIIVTIVWVVILALIGVGIYAINLSTRNSPEPTKPLPSVDINSTISNFELATKFPESISLKPINNKPVLNDRTFIMTNAGEPVYVSNDGNLNIGEQIVNNFPIQAPLTIYPIKLGFTISDYNQGVFLLKDESGYKVKSNPENISQVVPLNTGLDDFGFTSQEEYYYLSSSGQNQYTLNKSKTIQLDNPTQITNIETTIANSGYYQLFRSRNSLVIALFENPGQQGKAEYWIFKNNKLTLIDTLTNSWSTNVSENYLIVTKKELYSDLVSNYVNNIYDLNDENPVALDVAVPFLLRQNDIYGNMIARRCTASRFNEIYCLVKEKPVKNDNADQPDIVVKITPSKKKAEIFGNNRNVAPSSAIVGDWIRDRLLLSSQKDKLIYELPLK